MTIQEAVHVIHVLRAGNLREPQDLVKVREAYTMNGEFACELVSTLRSDHYHFTQELRVGINAAYAYRALMSQIAASSTYQPARA